MINACEEKIAARTKRNNVTGFRFERITTGDAKVPQLIYVL